MKIAVFAEGAAAEEAKAAGAQCLHDGERATSCTMFQSTFSSCSESLA